MIEKNDILKNPSLTEEDRRRIQQWLEDRQEMKRLISLGSESEEMIKIANDFGMTLAQFCVFKSLAYEKETFELNNYLLSRNITLPEELMDKLELKKPKENPYRYEYLNDYCEPVNLEEIIHTKEACDDFIRSLPPFAFEGDIRCIDTIFDEFNHISICDGFHLCYICKPFWPYVVALPEKEARQFVEKVEQKVTPSFRLPISKDLPTEAVDPCSVITSDGTADGFMEKYIFNKFVEMLDGQNGEEYYGIVFENPLNRNHEALFLQPIFWKPVYIPKERELRFFIVSRKKELFSTLIQETYEEVKLVICNFNSTGNKRSEVYPSQVSWRCFGHKEHSEIEETKIIVAKDPRAYTAMRINLEPDWDSYKKLVPHLLSFPEQEGLQGGGSQ